MHASQSWIFIMLAHWNNRPQGRHVTPLWHIILILSQPVVALTQNCMLSREATTTNFIDFSSTRPGLEPMVLHTQGYHVNHYITGVLFFSSWNVIQVCQKVSTIIFCTNSATSIWINLVLYFFNEDWRHLMATSSFRLV